MTTTTGTEEGLAAEVHGPVDYLLTEFPPRPPQWGGRPGARDLVDRGLSRLGHPLRQGGPQQRRGLIASARIPASDVMAALNALEAND